MNAPQPVPATDREDADEGAVEGVGPAPQSGWPSGPPPMLVGWSEIRSDLRSAVLLVSALGLTGIPAGIVWWLLAPRLDFRITSAGPVPVVAVPPEELLISDDGVFVLVVSVVGLLAGLVAWRLRRRRGVATVVALAVGMAACAAMAWQIGELLGPGPTRAALGHVGGVVTTSLTLGSLPAIAFGPFAALLVYLVAVLFTHSDDLGRPRPPVPVQPEPRESLPALS